MCDSIQILIPAVVIGSLSLPVVVGSLLKNGAFLLVGLNGVPREAKLWWPKGHGPGWADFISWFCGVLASRSAGPA